MVESDRERFPATLGLAVLWILVFVAMCVDQGTMQAVPGQVLSGGISTVTSSRFGDITPQAIYDGQWWRALTSTFIHYSWLHLGFNLVMLYTLGRLMEPWYGWGGFLGIYCVIGFFGSVLAVTIKPYFGHSLIEHSGGGSGVLCGLIAQLAIVGWRSKTRFGDYVKGQMVGLLAFIAVMGLVVPNVGNFEHGGGAVVGAVLGFGHRRLIRLADAGRGRVCGIASLLLLALCGAMQASTGADAQTRERGAAEIVNRMKARQETLQSLLILETFYVNVAAAPSEQSQPQGAALGSLIDPIQRQMAMQRLGMILQAPRNRFALRFVMDRQIQALSGSRSKWLPEEDASNWKVVEAQVQTALKRRPTPGEITAFRRALEKIMGDLSSDQKADEQALGKLQAQAVPKQKRPRPQLGR